MNRLHILLLINILIVFVSGCKKCDKNFKHINISDSSYNWIPDINSSVTFESNGKKWKFPSVKSYMHYAEHDNCIEGCCDAYYKLETRRLTTEDTTKYDNFHIAISPVYTNINQDSTRDFFSIMFTKYIWQDQNPRVSSFFTIPVPLDSLDYWAKSNNKFHPTLNINGKAFFDVYSFDGQVDNLSYNLPTKIFYTRREGIVGFEMLNGEVLNKK